VWPEIDKESLFKMVNISIRAGSTGQPNRMRERDQWMQLMPMIQQAIEKIAMYKQQNMPELVETTIKLLDETIKRFDEKLDSKELLGITEDSDGVEDSTQPPGMPPEIQAQMQQMQEQMQQMQEQAQQANQEIEQAKKELEQRAIQVKVEKIQQDASNSVAKIQAQATSEKIKSEALALANREEQFKLIQQHSAELQAMANASQDQGKSEELAASMAQMNQQLQVQIAAVMQSLAATNELMSAPKQVKTPSGQTYTMQTARAE
jgi:chromosome segregation ATPase